MSDTYVDNLAGEEITFLFGDGGSPNEAFASSCSINTNRKLDLTSELARSTSPNCTDPSKPAKTRSKVKALDIKFAGGGYADAASYKALVQRWQNGVAFNGEAHVIRSGSAMVIAGPWVIESIGLGGDAGEDATFDIALAIAGDWTLT